MMCHSIRPGGMTRILLAVAIILSASSIQAFIPRRIAVIPSNRHDITTTTTTTSTIESWLLQNKSRKKTTTAVFAAITTSNEDSSNEEEEKRLQMLASRRKSIRSMLKKADSVKQFRISNGLVSGIDEETGEPVNADGKVALACSAFVIATGTALLRLGGRAALISAVGLDFATDNPAIKDSMDTFLACVSSLDPTLEGFLFVLAWTFVKVFCFDVGGIVLALSSGILFDGVIRGALYSSLAATIGSSVAYYLATLDNPIRKRVLILLNQYPSLRGIERVAAEDGLKAVLTLRVAPIIPIPIGAYSYLYSVINVNYWDFAAGIFLGSVKPYLLDSYLGFYGKEVVDGTAGFGTDEDMVLVIALGVSTLVGVFATQLAAETWDAVGEEIEAEALRKGDIDSNGVIKKALGVNLPAWLYETQISLNEIEEEIERMIKAEYKYKAWDESDPESEKWDPTKLPASPEMLGTGSRYDMKTPIYNGLVLNPALIKAFFKYCDPYYNENKDKRKVYQFNDDRTSSPSEQGHGQIEGNTEIDDTSVPLSQRFRAVG